MLVGKISKMYHKNPLSKTDKRLNFTYSISQIVKSNPKYPIYNEIPNKSSSTKHGNDSFS